MRTLIVGGGPAGLILAIALRVRGLPADLVELNPEWTVLGTGLSLGGAPLRALKQVGLAERCVGTGFGSTTLTISNARGEVVSVVDRPRLNGPEFPPRWASSARCCTGCWPTRRGGGACTYGSG